jgi:PAS domain S-box-containing protein
MNTPINIDELTKDIVNNIQVGLHIYQLEDINDDRSLRMVYANKASEMYTGINPEAIIGKTLDDNFPGLREKDVPQKYADVVRSQKAVVLENVQYGDTRISESWFAVKVFPLPKNCVGVSFENITDKKGAEDAREELIKDLKQALEEITTLRGILPLCSFCKKIRDDKGFWQQVETYIEGHSQAEISHGICPDCYKKHYPGY